MNLDSLIINPWVGFIGTLFGVIGIILSVTFFLRSRRFQRPTYYKNSVKWFDKKTLPHEDIKFMFQGKEIPRFTITHIYFWNSGNQTIRKSDFAPASQLSLKIPENTEIFDIHISACSAKEIQASTSSDTSLVANSVKEVLINFDYLDENDGFSIQIIHDAENDDDFQFSGKLPGVFEFRRGDGLSVESPPLLKWVILPSLVIGAGYVGIWSIYNAVFKEFHSYQILGGMMIVYLILPFISLATISVPRSINASNKDPRIKERVIWHWPK